MHLFAKNLCYLVKPHRALTRCGIVVLTLHDAVVVVIFTSP